MGGSPTTYIGFWVEGNPFYFNYWYIDNVDSRYQETWGPTEGMSDWSPTLNMVTVENVFPEISVPDAIPDLIEEGHGSIDMKDIRITDDGMCKTESHAYRYDLDDNYGSIYPADGSWIYAAAPEDVRVLFFHSTSDTDETEPQSQQIVNALQNAENVASVTSFNFYNGGSYPTNPHTLDEMIANYDVIVFGCCYNQWYGPGNPSWDVREQFGDRLADWMDITGGGFVSMMYAYGQAGTPGGEQWTLIGRYMDDDYGPYEKTARVWNTVTLGTVHDPGHPVMQGVSSLGTDVRDGALATTPGGIVLADWSSGTPAIGVKELGNGARSVHLSGGGYDPLPGDFDQFISNAVNWAAGGGRQPCETIEVDYADNGIYNFDVQVIDDDMYWDFSGPQPVFVGPNNDPDDPGADPEDWISHNIIPIEVINKDPVISPSMRAYAQLDLRLRISGTKNCDATMTLYETIGDETTVLGTTSVTRDPGSPDIGIMPSVELLLNKENTYELVVEVTGGSGGNPTWIFDMVFPDGKYKEFKHTFNDEHGWTWVLDTSRLQGARLGHDIIFEAEANDSGSDDLAFVWNFGDSTPHGIHLFAQVDQTTAVDAVSDEATVIFDQLPDRDDFFDKGLNDERTPAGGPIYAKDMISHVFDDEQPYYYYVTLVVMDDDVGDDYPSDQLHPCPGCDMAFLELDFR
jgi:hypothetical protein